MVFLIPTQSLLDYVKYNASYTQRLQDVKHIAFIDKEAKKGFIIYNDPSKMPYELNTPFETFEQKDVTAGYYTVVWEVKANGKECISKYTCNHEYVNVGFTSITMACKHCGVDK